MICTIAGTFSIHEEWRMASNESPWHVNERLDPHLWKYSPLPIIFLTLVVCSEQYTHHLGGITSGVKTLETSPTKLTRIILMISYVGFF